MAVRLSALRACRPLPPPPQRRFLVLIPVRVWVDPRAIMRLEELDQFKKSNVLIGNRTRDLAACRIMPQPTPLPRASFLSYPFNGPWTPKGLWDVEAPTFSRQSSTTLTTFILHKFPQNKRRDGALKYMTATFHRVPSDRYIDTSSTTIC
jgi:hypothetical protein